MWKTMNKHFNLHTKGFFFSLRGTISFWEQVKAQDDEDKRSTCSNLYAKPHTKPLKNINIWLCLWCTDRLSVCRSRNPTIINVFSTINYKKREKVRKNAVDYTWVLWCRRLNPGYLPHSGCLQIWPWETRARELRDDADRHFIYT